MTQATGNLKVILEGRGPLVIRPAVDHVATGGEGSVYRSGDTVVKIYTDAEKMRRDDMAGKIKLLSALHHPFVVAPLGAVIGPRGEPIGYYMPFAAGEPLPRVFTNDFRMREGFSDQHAAILAEGMREVVRFAHENKAILVDANELSWIARLQGKKNPEPRIIDVDSWAIGRWPATVIMPSIRDWQSKTFDEKSDWFAWGIVTFQVFAGIHPYKGTLASFDRKDLVGRMKAGASVFAPGIRLNQAVRDFSLIPAPLLDWYEATFQQGERTIPPSPLATGAPTATLARVARVVTTASGRLMYDKLFASPSDPAIRVFPCGAVLTASGRLIDLSSKREIGKPLSREGEAVRKEGGWLKSDWKNGSAEFSFVAHDFSEEPLTLTANVYRVIRFENRLFALTDTGLSELILKVFAKPVLSIGNTWGVMQNSTRWYDGVGIQDAMGATYLVAPFGEDACTHVRVRELDGMKPVAAKAGQRFIAVSALDAAGTYQKFEFSMANDYRTYRPWQGTVDSPDLNVAILPKGVCATIVEDGELTIFVPTNGNLNKVSDRKVATDMLLMHWENRVVYIFQGEVWQVRLT